MTSTWVQGALLLLIALLLVVFFVICVSIVVELRRRQPDTERSSTLHRFGLSVAAVDIVLMVGNLLVGSYQGGNPGSSRGCQGLMGFCQARYVRDCVRCPLMAILFI